MTQKGYQKIGVERIWRLFELAEEEFPKHPERSNRYVEIALNINMKTKCGIPFELKKKFCKKCKNFLVEGKNCDIQKERDLIVIICKACGRRRKIGIKPKIS